MSICSFYGPILMYKLVVEVWPFVHLTNLGPKNYKEITEHGASYGPKTCVGLNHKIALHYFDLKNKTKTTQQNKKAIIMLKASYAFQGQGVKMRNIMSTGQIEWNSPPKVYCKCKFNMTLLGHHIASASKRQIAVGKCYLLFWEMTL